MLILASQSLTYYRLCDADLVPIIVDHGCFRGVFEANAAQAAAGSLVQASASIQADTPS